MHNVAEHESHLSPLSLLSSIRHVVHCHIDGAMTLVLSLMTTIKMNMSGGSFSWQEDGNMAGPFINHNFHYRCNQFTIAFAIPCFNSIYCP